MRKTFLIHFVLFLAMAMSVFYIQKFMGKNKDGDNLQNDHTPDAYMINASYIRTSDQGKEEIKLFSPMAHHYHDKDTCVFEKPNIKIHKNGQQWLVTSKTAQSIEGAKTLYFQKNVKLQQLSTQNQTTLLTEFLAAFPKTNQVMTHDLFTIKQKGLTVTGKGLRADLDKGNIELLSQTRGQYDPAHP